jgi:hypothetical protein
MLYVRFEPTILASERAKTVHALDRSTTVTGRSLVTIIKLKEQGRHVVISRYKNTTVTKFG